MKNIKAIIYCGGDQTKIFPYNNQWQSSCIPVGNKSNVLRIVHQLKDNNIFNIVVMAEEKTQQVSHVLRKENVKVVEVNSNNVVAKFVAESDSSDTYMVYYGTSVINEPNIKNLIKEYSKKGNSLLYENYTGDNFNLIDHIGVTVKDGEVKSFYGHPRSKRYATGRSVGVFMVDKELFKQVQYVADFYPKVPVGGMPTNEFFFEKCMQLAIEDKKKINAVDICSKFVELRFPWDIMSANFLYCEEVIAPIKKSIIHKSCSIDKTAIIRGNVIIGENSTIGEHVIIEGNCIIGANSTIATGAIIGANSAIGDNTIVNYYCKLSSETVIGNYNKIGYNADVSGVTFDNVSAVHNCEVGGLIGKNVDIAAGCQMCALRFDDSKQSHVIAGKKYSGEHSNAVFIGDSVRTGVGNIFYPGVKIGSNSCIGPGVILCEDLPEGSLITVKQEHVIKKWGSGKYGW